MAGNTFGTVFRLTTFGESHGKAIGGIIDGFPSGVEVDLEFVGQQLLRRKPGQSSFVSSRHESDEVEILSGLFKGKSLGTPISFLVWNKDAHSGDYDHLKAVFRPSHADYTYEQKYGIRDFRGGGRSSARETVARVVGGAFAQMLLGSLSVKITAYTSQIGSIGLKKDYRELEFDQIEKSPLRCPDSKVSQQMEALIKQTAIVGDTLGGIVTCVVSGAPACWGEPVFDKLHADLAKAMLSINAVKGFEIGSGFSAAAMTGSHHNDIFIKQEDKITTATNFSGGIQGGISNGNDIYFRVAFKPVATLMREQKSLDTEAVPVIISGKGRHDVCVVPRAVPIVEAMTALVLADHYLRNKTAKQA